MWPPLAALVARPLDQSEDESFQSSNLLGIDCVTTPQIYLLKQSPATALMIRRRARKLVDLVLYNLGPTAGLLGEASTCRCKRRGYSATPRSTELATAVSSTGFHVCLTLLPGAAQHDGDLPLDPKMASFVCADSTPGPADGRGP